MAYACADTLNCSAARATNHENQHPYNVQKVPALRRLRLD